MSIGSGSDMAVVGARLRRGRSDGGGGGSGHGHPSGLGASCAGSSAGCIPNRHDYMAKPASWPLVEGRKSTPPGAVPAADAVPPRLHLAQLTGRPISARTVSVPNPGRTHPVSEGTLGIKRGGAARRPRCRTDEPGNPSGPAPTDHLSSPVPLASRPKRLLVSTCLLGRVRWRVPRVPQAGLVKAVSLPVNTTGRSVLG